MSFGNRVDANHAEQRDEYFRKLCKACYDCSQSGMGLADLLILTNDDILYMVEVKDGKKIPSKRRLTPMQRAEAYRFGDKFLVSTSAKSAIDISTKPEERWRYTGILYAKETNS